MDYLLVCSSIIGWLLLTPVENPHDNSKEKFATNSGIGRWCLAGVYTRTAANKEKREKSKEDGQKYKKLRLEYKEIIISLDEGIRINELNEHLFSFWSFLSVCLF